MTSLVRTTSSTALTPSSVSPNAIGSTPFLPPLNFTYFPSTITYLKSPHLQLLGLELGVPNTGRRRALSTSLSSMSNSSPVQHG